MTPADTTPEATWPLHDEFFVEVEDHCEDGSWSGYAHSDEYPRSQDTKRAILLSKHTHLLAEAVAKAEREAKALARAEAFNEAMEAARRMPQFLCIQHFAEEAQKASELRKGATPENGGKDEL